MNKQNKTDGQLIHGFMLFTANYPHLFIEHCWKGKGTLMTHLRDKFHSSKGVTDFWFMLDVHNRDIFADYISKWVKGRPTIHSSNSVSNEIFHEDYKTSTNLSWNEVKDCLGSKYQKEFYWNLCVTKPCRRINTPSFIEI